jgi:regulator of protease activity HflC (stomatin/prohibitin superfamily)
MGGISSIIGAVALLGFLAFLAGVGLVVVSASQGRPVRGGILLAVVGLVSGFVLLIVSEGIIVVEPQQVAVVFETVSGDLGTPRLAGTHVIIPLLQDATLYDIDQKEYTMSGVSAEGRNAGDDAVRARTSDGQEVRLDITVIYRINPDEVNSIHTRWQNRFEGEFIRPSTVSTVQTVLSQFDAQQVYGEERADIEQQIQERVSVLMISQGLELQDLLIRDVTFTTEFANSIEQAQIAAQDAERARLRIQEFEAEADQARAQARGLADAEIERARGSAEATILGAQAQAEALRLVSDQIAANPALLQYQYIQRLADNINLALVPSNSPFLFDFSSFQDLAGQADPNFVAPPVPESTLIPPATDSTSSSDGG